MIGSDFDELLHHRQPHGGQHPIENCAFQKAITAHQSIHSVDEFYSRKDGRRFPAECSAHPLPQPMGRTAFVITFQDLTKIQQDKDALRQSEEKFRRILASTPDVAWTSDRSGRKVYISPKVESMLGYSKQEICASGANLWLGRIHPGDFGRVTEAYAALFEKQSAFDQEYRICRKDGAWIWVYDRATRTHEEDGVILADGILSDITQRKRAETELQSQTAFLEAQTNSTIDGILVVNRRNQRLLLNQRMVELFNIPPDVAADENDQRLLNHVVTLVKDPGPFLARINHLNRHPRETSRDEIELTDGRIFDRYSSPVVGKNGTYYGRIWAFRDITERKRNEDTLQQLSAAVEQSPVSIVITDPQGKISYVNSKFTETTGYGPEEVVGKTPGILKSGITSPEVYRSLWSTVRQGRQWQGELCNRKKSGEIYWESATIRPITNAKGGITHFLAIKEDITEKRRAEEALRASEKRYRLLFERNLAGVLRTTLEGRVLECNQAAARMFGYDSPEEVLNLRAADFYQESSDREAFLSKLKSEKGLTNQEMKCRRKDGESVWVIANLSLIEDELAGVGIVEGTVVDITERKRAEEQVRELLDSIPEAIYGIDLEGRCTSCNPSCLQLLGYEHPADLLGKDMHTLIHHSRQDGTHYPEEECHIFEAFRRGQGTHVDNEVLWRRDGTSFAAEYWSHPIHRGGKVIGAVVTFVDITERKRAETELRLTQFSLERASDAVEWIDSQARIVYVNQAECLALGHSREELLALSIPDINPLFPMERWWAFWEELKARGPMTFETQHQTKEGRVFPVEVTANYLEFNGQEYCFAFARDITERRALETQLRHAQKLEGIGQLAAGIAHEINTPTQFVTDNLTFLRDSWKSAHTLLDHYRSAIRNSAGLLPPGVATALKQAEQDCDLDFIVAEMPRAIDQSLDGSRRVAKIVRAMKEFSHPDSADKTATNLNRAIESTITVARNEWKYIAEITTEFDETLPAVVCYPGDINQVILNLLVNAAHAVKDAMPDGQMGRITVRTRKRDDFAEISVTDTGTGVPEAIRSRIFDPFFTTKEVGKGTGQGLSLAHNVVVKKHSGKIWFETELGRGTTFFVDLPISPLEVSKEN
jgi:PAS domain S-box-containing protein